MDSTPPPTMIDMPPDFGIYDEPPRISPRLSTLLTGLGIGILLGLAWGQVWAMMGGLS